MAGLSFKRKFSTIFYRPLLSRIVAAIIGGYLFTNVMSVLLFFLLADSQLIDPQTNAVNPQAVGSVLDSMQWSQLMSLAIYTAAAMWVFHTKTASRAWTGLLLSSLIGIGVIYFLLPSGLILAVKEVLATVK